MPVEGIHRPAWAEVSRAAIVANASAIKAVIGATSLCAVVKADGYGHGATLAAAAALDGGADTLGVATIDEGVELRKAGFEAPILVLAEVAPTSIPLALTHGLTVTVGSMAGATALVACAKDLGEMCIRDRSCTEGRLRGRTRSSRRRHSTPRPPSATRGGGNGQSTTCDSSCST